MPITVHRTGESLATTLTNMSIPIDTGCGGQGRCGRCRVSLLNGRWLINGHESLVTSPTPALACQCRLLSESANVEIPNVPTTDSGAGIDAVWYTSPMPDNPAPVVAIDIGTTCIAAVKLLHGRVVANACCLNAQNRLGDNVASRITLAGTPTGLERLRRALLTSINTLLTKLGELDAVTMTAVSGNTVMSCLFHGIDPSSIGVYPFTPPCREFPLKTGTELGLVCPAPVMTLPAISGYVGGDLTAGLGEIDLKPGEMLVDIGTNCEMIFNAGTRLLCTAAAAGPAFEGAGLSCACRAIPGAIDHVGASFTLSCIGDVSPPAGLCGSALLDFLAVARSEGRLSAMGRLLPRAHSISVAPGLSITEKDIEQLLKAKAAVAAGIKTIAEYADTPVNRIHLAGAFANHLNIDNARAINMLPEAPCNKLGNTSLAGAARLACSPERMQILSKLANLPDEIPLNTVPDFEDNYINALFLP